MDKNRLFGHQMRPIFHDPSPTSGFLKPRPSGCYRKTSMGEFLASY